MPRPPFDHFRFVAPIYDRFFNPRLVDQRHIRAALDLPAAGWLLDAGGGTGRVSQLLRDQVGGVVVVDGSPGMLRQARRKAGLCVAHALVEQLPFADGLFARILVVDAFHHFHDHERAARELWRVLRPGGRLLIEEPNIERWPVKLVALGEKLLLMRSRFFRAGELRRLFSRQPDARVAVRTDGDPFSLQVIVDKVA